LSFLVFDWIYLLQIRLQASLAHFNANVREELFQRFPTLTGSPLLSPDVSDILGRNVLPDAYELHANAALLRRILMFVCT
jgi:hypothetical protein